MPYPQASALPTKALPTSKRLGYETFPLLPQVPFPVVKEALLRQDGNRPRAMIVHHGNPVIVQANEKRTRRAMEKLDFLMVTDIFPTATTEIADLVLPIASDFETYSYRAYSSLIGGFLALGRPVSDPVGESKSVFEVEFELAKKMNQHQDYPFQEEKTWIDYMIRPNGVSFERLESEQIVYTTSKVKYHKYLDKGFDTPSGKVEFFSNWFLKMGAPPPAQLLRPGR